MEPSRNNSRSLTQFWKRNIESWRQSGLSQKQYCHSHGLALSTFCYWKRKLQDQDCKLSQRFYPLAVTSKNISTYAGDGGKLILHLDRYKLEIQKGFDADHLTAVIAVLQRTHS